MTGTDDAWHGTDHLLHQVSADLQGLRGIPFLEVEVDAAGRTVLCYLPLYALKEAEKYLKRETTELKSAPALLEEYTPPTLQEIIEAQDSVTSARLIEVLSSSPRFDAFAMVEGADILARDNEAPPRCPDGVSTQPESDPLLPGRREARQGHPDRDRQRCAAAPGRGDVPAG